jgi:hypothetical protein
MIMNTLPLASEGVRLHSKADAAAGAFSAKRLRPTVLFVVVA